MKFGVIVSERKAEIHEHELFSVQPDEVLIQNKSCNLCTTDYQQWMGLRPHQPTPMAFGHENAGIVTKTGDNVNNLQVGDHVVVNIYRPCLECVNCRKGLSSVYCLNLSQGFGQKNEYGYFGAYGCGEYQVFKAKHVFKISKDLPFEFGGFCEPLATVIHGIHKLNLGIGDKVLVIGAGTMGVLNAQAARYYGADVIISELSEKKLRTVEKMGFQKLVNSKEDNFKEKIAEYTLGKGLDAIIIAVGSTGAYNQALEVAAKGCKLLIFAAGYPKPDWNLDPNSVHYQLWNIIGTYGCSTCDFQEASEMLSAGHINVEYLVEERFELKDLQKAFERASTPDMYRISVMI
jgi:threonine dehydrogenase-like Zn-dependent dehydrogenase